MTQEASQYQDTIPAGNYDAVCTGDVQYGETSKGNDQIGIQLDIQGHLATAILYDTPGARPYTIAKLKACGWTGGDIGPQIKGKPCRVSVKYEPWTNPETGETSRNMKVDIYDGSGGITFSKPMSDSKKSQFLASLSQAAGVAQQGGPDPWEVNGHQPPTQSTQTQTAPAGRFSLNK